MINQAVWKTYIDLGATAYEQGYHEMADKMMEAALEEAQRLGHNDSSLATIFNRLAYIYYQQGNAKKAENVYKRALSMYEKVLENTDPRLGNLLLNFAELYFAERKYAQAGPLYERAIAIETNINGKDSPLLEKRLMKLAYVYCTQGRHDDAHKLYKQVKEIREQQLAARQVTFGMPELLHAQ
jgi:tetratricopeptide (TPR) repeat protein